MTYATLGVALARLGRNGDLSTTTVPSLTEAGAIHAGISGEIDAALASSGLTVPVTTPASLVAWLTEIEIHGVCAEVLRARFQDAQGINSSSTATYHQERFKAGMDRLWSGVGLDELTGSACMPEGYFTRNPDEAEDLGDLVDGLREGLTTMMDL